MEGETVEILKNEMKSNTDEEPRQADTMKWCLETSWARKKDTGVRAKSNLIDIFNLLLTLTSQKDQSKNLFIFFQIFVKSFLYKSAYFFFFLVWGTLIISEHWFREKTLKLLKRKSHDTLLLRSLVRLLIDFLKKWNF